MSDENLISGLAATAPTSTATGNTIDLSNVFSGFLPAYQSAMNSYSNIPGLVSNMTGYNQTVQGFNNVANQRAAQGIMGGTEAENLRANTLTGLVSSSGDTALNLLNQKNSLLGLGLSSDQGWASQIMNLIRAGYTG